MVAEQDACDFFLSLDFKLARVIGTSKNKPKVSIVRPSQLVAALGCGEWSEPSPAS
jgi:hypothetical protein